MRKTTKLTESSDLYRKVDELGLSNSDRDRAINALITAEKLVDAIVYGIELLRRVPNRWLGSGTAKLKHQ